jgi:hypothetical protein
MVTDVNVEWELGPDSARTGCWRRRQFYATPGIHPDRRVPSERPACEWRKPRPGGAGGEK